MRFIDHIVGTESVVEALGYWPTFHDAEVISFSAERGLPFKKDYSVARLSVQVRKYELFGEGTASYEQRLQKNLLIHFAFRGACEFELSDFNHQNVINSLTVSLLHNDEVANLHVEIESIWGFGGSLRCSSAEVERLQVLPNAEA